MALSHSEHKPRIFVSSRITGLEDLRRRVAETIEALNLDAWVFERKPGSSQPLEESYRDYATRSMRLIWITTAVTSQATSEEVHDALRLGIPVLAFVIEGPDPDTQELLDAIDGKRVQALAEADVSEAVRLTLEDELWRGLRPPGGPGGAGPPPPPPADFTGRDHEIEVLGGHMANGAVTLISGMPGIGKSALAHVAAHHGWADLALFLDLRLAQRPAPAEDSLRRLLVGMGVSEGALPSGLEGLRARWLAETDERRVLVIVDDAAIEAEVRPLLPGGDGAAVITARRELLGLEGVARMPLETLNLSDSRRFLSEALGDERVDAEPDQADRLHDLTGGLPLALRITAARLASRPNWTLADYAARLADERSRLANLEAGDLAVRASFNLSFDLLSGSEADAFRTFGFFRGPTVATAAISAALDRGCESDLESVADAQLLVSREPQSFEIHDLLRLFAKERLDDLPNAERRVHLQRIVDHYQQAGLARSRAIMESKPLEGDESPLAWLDRETENIMQLAKELTGLSMWAELGGLALDSGGLYSTAGRWRQWEGLLELGLRASKALGDAQLQSKLTLNLGICAESLGKGDAAKERLEEAIKVGRTADERSVEAGALAHLGTLRKKGGDPRAAMKLTGRALEIYRQIGHEVGEAKALGDLANQLDDLNDLDEAIRRHREAIKAFDRLGDLSGLARERGNLGVALQRNAQFEAAEVEYRRSEEIWVQLGARFSAAATRRRLAEIAFVRGNLEASEALADAAVSDLDSLDARADLSAALAVRGAARQGLGNEEGRQDLHEAIQLYRQVDAEAAGATELVNLSDRLSPHGAMSPLLEEARAGFQRAGGGPYPAHANAAQKLALVALVQGRLHDAELLLIELVTLTETLSPPPDNRHALALLHLARLQAEIGRHEASETLAAARAVDVELPPEPGERIEKLLALDLEVAGAGDLELRIRRAAAMALDALDWVVTDLTIRIADVSAGSAGSAWSISEGQLEITDELVRSRIGESDQPLWMLLHDLIARYSLISLGVDSRDPVGDLLIAAAGAWFVRTTVGAEIPIPLPAYNSDDPARVGIFLGAALAGDEAAGEALLADQDTKELRAAFERAKDECSNESPAAVLQWMAGFWSAREG